MSLKRDIKLFQLFNFFGNFNFYIPIQLVYFQHVTGSFALATGIVSVATLSTAFWEVPTGIFSDFVGRKKTMILGSISAIIGTTLYALGFNYWMLLVGAGFQGLAQAFFSGNNNAYLHNLLSKEGLEEDYHTFYGKVSSFGIAAASGTAFLTGTLATISFSLVMWATVIPQVIALLIGFFLPEVKNIRGEGNVFAHLKNALSELRRNVNLRYLSLSGILGNGAGMTASEFHPAVVYAVWPLWAIGMVRAFAELVCVPGYYFAGKIIKKFGAINISLFGTIQSWISNIIAAIFPSVFSPVFISSSAFLYGPSDTANESLLQKEFTEKQRATIASLNSLVGKIYFSILALGVGLFADQYGPFKALLLTQVLFTPTIILKFLLFKRMKNPAITDPNQSEAKF